MGLDVLICMEKEKIFKGHAKEKQDNYLVFSRRDSEITCLL